MKGVDRVKGGGIAPPVTPAVETEANVDSWGTYKRVPWLVVGLVVLVLYYRFLFCLALQRQNAENLKQIFPEKEYRGLSPNFHIHVSESELYILTMGLPFLLEEICGPILGIYIYQSQTHECGNWTEAGNCCCSVATLVSPVQNIIILTAHFVTFLVHIAKQPGQAVVLGRPSLCLRTRFNH